MKGKLKTILTAYHDDMILSLSIGGIDLRTANRNTEIINQNAYKKCGNLDRGCVTAHGMLRRLFADHHSWLPQGVHDDGHDGNDLCSF